MVFVGPAKSQAPSPGCTLLLRGGTGFLKYAKAITRVSDAGYIALCLLVTAVPCTVPAPSQRPKCRILAPVKPRVALPSRSHAASDRLVSETASLVVLHVVPLRGFGQWALFVGRNVRLESGFLFDQGVVPRSFPALPLLTGAGDSLTAAIAGASQPWPNTVVSHGSTVLETVTNGTQEVGDVDPSLPGVTVSALLPYLPRMQELMESAAIMSSSPNVTFQLRLPVDGGGFIVVTPSCSSVEVQARQLLSSPRPMDSGAGSGMVDRAQRTSQRRGGGHIL